MSAAISRCAVVVSVLFLAACGQSSPIFPTGTPQPPGTPVPPSTPSPPAQVSFPPLSGPSRTFVFDRELSYPVRDFTRNSRWVLYDNGAFELRYPDVPIVLDGSYQDTSGSLNFLFEFQGRPVGSAFDATGTLEGDVLTIRFSDVMQQNDYEDAVYVEVR